MISANDPFYQDVARQLEALILDRTLLPGSKIPSERQLAGDPLYQKCYRQRPISRRFGTYFETTQGPYTISLRSESYWRDNPPSTLLYA